MSLAASLEGMAITITSSALASRHQRSEGAVTVKLECKEFTSGLDVPRRTLVRAGYATELP
jgi:hypothetical protein